MFNMGLKFGYIISNPITCVKQILLPHKERISFNDNDLSQLLNTIQTSQFKNIVLFGLLTGCRLNEILNMLWKDVIINERFLFIRNKSNFKTKTDKIRTIPISENLYNLLIPIKNEKNNHKEDLIFPNDKGKVYSKSYISRKFKKYVLQADLSSILHFHSLRYIFLTTLATNGVPVYYLKELAGYSNIKTTEIYLHAIANDLREAVEKIKLQYAGSVDE